MSTSQDCSASDGEPEPKAPSDDAETPPTVAQAPAAGRAKHRRASPDTAAVLAAGPDELVDPAGTPTESKKAALTAAGVLSVFTETGSGIKALLARHLLTAHPAGTDEQPSAQRSASSHAKPSRGPRWMRHTTPATTLMVAASAAVLAAVCVAIVTLTPWVPGTTAAVFNDPAVQALRDWESGLDGNPAAQEAATEALKRVHVTSLGDGRTRGAARGRDGRCFTLTIDPARAPVATGSALGVPTPVLEPASRALTDTVATVTLDRPDACAEAP